MSRRFCVVCHGPLVPGALPDQTRLAMLAMYLSAVEAQQVFRATQANPKTLMADGVSLELSKELDAAFLNAGLLSQICVMDGADAPEIFVEQRVRQRRSEVLSKIEEKSDGAIRRRPGRRKGDK